MKRRRLLWLPCVLAAVLLVAGLPTQAAAATGGTITGRISILGGGPGADLCVEARDTDKMIDGVTSTRAGADGSFSLQVPAAPRYVLRVVAGSVWCPRPLTYPEQDVAPTYNGGGYDANTAPRLSVTPGSTVAVDVAVPRGAHITGTLTDRFTGAPVPRVNVFVHTEDSAASGAGRTDEQGRYDIGQLPGARYRVHFSAAEAGYRSVYFDEAVFRADATLVPLPQAGRVTVNSLLDRGATVTGRVSDAAGNGIEHVRVTLDRDGPCCVQVGPLMTTADGLWSATGVTPGNYRVRYEPYHDKQFVGQWWPKRLTQESAGLLPVATSAPAVADVVLDRGGTIEGTAAMTDGTTPQLCVSAVDSTATPLLSAGSWSGSWGGGWFISGLRPGRYAVSYRDCNHGDGAAVAERYFGSGSSSSTARHVDVVAGQTTTLPQQVLEFAGTLTGTVRTSDDKAVPWGTTIELSREGHFVRTQLLEGSGRYTLHGLAPGVWSVRALTCSYNTSYAPSSSAAAVVSSGQTTTAPDSVITPSTSDSCPAPPAPTGVAVSAGPASVSVRWIPPTRDVPAPLESYEVTLHPTGRTLHVSPHDSDGAIFAGLAADQPVWATVRAWSPRLGPSSAASNAVTPGAGPEAEPARAEPATAPGGDPAAPPEGSPAPSPTPSSPAPAPPTASPSGGPPSGGPPSPEPPSPGSPTPTPTGSTPAPEPTPSLAETDPAVRPLPPARVLDTRDGTGGIAGRLPSNSPVRLQVTGRAGVPSSGVQAVLLNTTVTGARAAGHLTVFPGSTAPLASNLNYATGSTVANLVLVPVADDGTIALQANTGSPHALADVVGYVADRSG